VGESRLSDAFKEAQGTLGCHIPSTKPSQGLIDVQDEVRGGESMMSLVPWESTVRVFYSRFHSRFAPGFAPDSRSNIIALRRTRSGRIAYNFNANIAHGLTPSLSPLIALLRRRPFKRL